MILMDEVPASMVDRVVFALECFPGGATAHTVAEFMGFDPRAQPGKVATVSAALIKAARRGLCNKSKPPSSRRNAPLCGHVAVFTPINSDPSDAANILSILSG